MLFHATSIPNLKTVLFSLYGKALSLKNQYIIVKLKHHSPFNFMYHLYGNHILNANCKPARVTFFVRGCGLQLYRMSLFVNTSCFDCFIV